jgi:hypothetical protein
MLAYECPICVGLIDEERKCEVSGPIFGFCRSYGRAHEAGCRVDEDTYGCFAVGVVRDGAALEKTPDLLVWFTEPLREGANLLVLRREYVPARTVRISDALTMLTV